MYFHSNSQNALTYQYPSVIYLTQNKFLIEFLSIWINAWDVAVSELNFPLPLGPAFSPEDKT